MKKILAILIAIIPFQNSIGQNLVQNPSFENYTICPTGYDEVSNTVDWSSYSESPDYFNSCTSGGFSTPSNFMGYQVPHTGNAYCGIITFDKVGLYREVIGSLLSSPLVIGQKYYVSFYASLGIKAQNFAYASNKIGAKFTTNAYVAYSNQIPINNTSQLHYDTIITDTTNWTLIYGSFIADSAYQYISIGNFFDDLHTDTICIENVTYKLYAYYYIDDVYVSSTPLEVNELANNNEVILFQNEPNPFDENTIIRYYIPDNLNSNVYVVFYDSYGKEIKKTEIKEKGNGQINADAKNLTGGCYSYSLIIDGVVKDTKKMIKE